MSAKKIARNVDPIELGINDYLGSLSDDEIMNMIGKSLGGRIDFLPALMPEVPAGFYLYEDVIDMRFLRPGAYEVIVRMTETCYMSCYFMQQYGHVHVACRWDDILDFVWKGFEAPTAMRPFYEVRTEFREKYPRIASLFGQKENRNGIPLPEPYITTIGLDGQPKVWWLSIKLVGVSDDRFDDWNCLGICEDHLALEAIDKLRYACADIFSEIKRSDAKSPKELMHRYFGVDSLKKTHLADIL